MTAEKYYEVLDPDGLVVTGLDGKEHRLRQGRIVPRSMFGGTITWLLDGKHVKESEAPPADDIGEDA